jgi:myo-inositol-1(or 4)-monophosphatase
MGKLILQSVFREEQGVHAEYAAVAAEAVLKAGAIQKARYGQQIEIRHKGEINVVTDVDRACEDEILATLRARFPSHDIVTEETALARTGSRHVWFTDPLDGTTNFAHGYPMFCSSVALAIDGEVVAGAVYDPLREELFTAERGGGAHANGRRLSVSSCSTLLQALLVTGFPYDIRTTAETNLPQYAALSIRSQAVRRLGSAVLDLCYVACGRLDGFWELSLGPWDMAAGGLIVQEAGGRVTNVCGGPWRLEGPGVLASNGRVHDAMLSALGTARAVP